MRESKGKGSIDAEGVAAPKQPSGWGQWPTSNDSSVHGRAKRTGFFPYVFPSTPSSGQGIPNSLSVPIGLITVILAPQL